MRFYRGVVKIPVKLLWVVAFLFATIVYLAISFVQNAWVVSSGLEPPCKMLPPHLPSTSARRDRHSPGVSTHGSCSRPSRYTGWEKCPTCFRPNVVNLSKSFTQVNKLHPRAPKDFFRPRKEVVQDVANEYLIEPQEVCQEGGPCPYLLILQMSITDHEEERNVIRTTWASVAKTQTWPKANVNAKVQVLFVLGHQTVPKKDKIEPHGSSPWEDRYETDKQQPYRRPTKAELDPVVAEADKHGDILYLDMFDSYSNLTLKVLSSFKWVRDHCPFIKFVLKVDADTFVNVPLLVDLLIYNEERFEYSIIGTLYEEGMVFRTGRWAVDANIYPMSSYPIYASGCGYIVSFPALLTLMEVSIFVPILPVEDVHITGVLARIVRVPRFGHMFLFTHLDDDRYEWCDFLSDMKVMGTNLDLWFVQVYSSHFVHRKDECSMPPYRFTCYCDKRAIPRWVRDFYGENVPL